MRPDLTSSQLTTNLDVFNDYSMAGRKLMALGMDVTSTWLPAIGNTDVTDAEIMRWNDDAITHDDLRVRITNLI